MRSNTINFISLTLFLIILFQTYGMGQSQQLVGKYKTCFENELEKLTMIEFFENQIFIYSTKTSNKTIEAFRGTYTLRDKMIVLNFDAPTREEIELYIIGRSTPTISLYNLFNDEKFIRWKN